MLDAMDGYKNIDVSYTEYEEMDTADEGDIIVSIGGESKILTDDSLFEFHILTTATVTRTAL